MAWQYKNPPSQFFRSCWIPNLGNQNIHTSFCDTFRKLKRGPWWLDKGSCKRKVLFLDLRFRSCLWCYSLYILCFWMVSVEELTTELKTGSTDYTTALNAFEDSFLLPATDCNFRVKSIQKLSNDAIFRRFSLWQNDLKINVRRHQYLFCTYSIVII